MQYIWCDVVNVLCYWSQSCSIVSLPIWNHIYTILHYLLRVHTNLDKRRNEWIHIHGHSYTCLQVYVHLLSIIVTQGLISCTEYTCIIMQLWTVSWTNLYGGPLHSLCIKSWGSTPCDSVHSYLPWASDLFQFTELTTQWDFSPHFLLTAHFYTTNKRQYMCTHAGTYIAQGG